jgi:hypothetical protein
MRPVIAKTAFAGLLPLLLVAMPAGAATRAEKMEICKAGAAHDNLAGKKRDDFMKKCMGTGNYEPQARRDAMKKGAAKPKPAAAPAAEPEEEAK